MSELRRAALVFYHFYGVLICFNGIFMMVIYDGIENGIFSWDFLMIYDGNEEYPLLMSK